MIKDLCKLGKIELDDCVYVSDPCYNTGTWCQALVKGLKQGVYHGFMYKAYTDWDKRVTDLWIVHEDNIKAFPKKLVKGVVIGVDSGSAGIFDKEYFEKYHTFENDKNIDDYSESNAWYEKQFDLRYNYDEHGKRIDTSHDDFGRLIKTREPADGISLDNKCVISFSGYGDGGYSLYEARNKKGQIVGLRIKFI